MARYRYPLLRIAVALTALLFVAVLCGCEDEGESRHQEFTVPTPEGQDNGSETAYIAGQRTINRNSDSDYLSSPMLTDETPGPDLTNSPTLDEGPSQPTAHTHWVRGLIQNGSVEIQVNNMTIGIYSGPIDEDITWKCHPGANSITFAWTPSSSGATARLELIEGEHEASYLPLVTWHPDPAPTDSQNTVSAARTTRSSFIFAAN